MKTHIHEALFSLHKLMSDKNSDAYVKNQAQAAINRIKMIQNHLEKTTTL